MSIVDIIFAFLLVAVGVINVFAIAFTGEDDRRVWSVAFTIAAITISSGFWLLRLAVVQQ